MFAASKTATPSGGGPDAQFNYVTMLLHGDGTNGAQNNTFLDSSTNNFTITRNGNTTQGSFSPYGSNWSNFFDGTGDYLTVPDNSAWAFGSGNFTLEAWVYRTVNGATQMIVIQSDNASAAGSAWSFYILSTNKLVSNVYYGSSFITLTSSADVPANAWVHVALVRTSGTISQYINGSRDGTSASLSTNSLNDVAQTVGIGATNAGNERITGYISNLRVIKGAGPYDATSSTLTVPTAPLTAITNTQLLTCQSNRFIDTSANNFTITRNGDTSVQRFNPFGTSTAYSTSVIGGSGYFDGSGDYLNTSANATQFGTGDFTIEFWIYFNAVNNSTTKFIFDMRNAGATSASFLAQESSNNWTFWNGAGTSISSGFTSSTFKATNWTHVAISRSSGVTKFFVNGTQTNSVADTSNYATSTLALGARYTGSDFLNAYVSDLRLVKGTALYTSSFTPPTAPLTAVTNTSLLLNCTNGAIFDNAMMNDLETVGNAQISTSVVKYGTGSMYFDGTGDALAVSNKVINSLDTGAFTIEMWVYRLGNGTGGASAYDALLGSNIDAASALYGIYVTRSSGVINFFNSAGLVSSSNSLSNSSWTHIAISRTSANNLQIFINGVSGYSATNTGTGTLINPLFIASDNTTSGNSKFYGYIDDLRITKGYARYTSNFTPPTSALSDKGPI